MLAGKFERFKMFLDSSHGPPRATQRCCAGEIPAEHMQIMF